MAPNDNAPLSALQPDLEEFLSALSGFLTKETVPSDPGNLRFLEIFFRTVKSEKGHLLKASETGDLKSIISYGIDPQFDTDFNKTHAQALNEPSPLDVAFRQKDAVAIVDLSKEPDVPPWFDSLMKKYSFKSLVAVPLMGVTEPIGILCAYYNDVCLFDQATLGHLMMIGRMVGGATEKSLVADRAESHGEKEKVADRFLKILTSKAFSKAQVYTLMAKIYSEAVQVSGLICGPVVKTTRGLTLSVAAGVGLPSLAASPQVLLPAFITTKFLSGLERNDFSTHSNEAWGEMEPLVKFPLSVEVSRPLSWQNMLEGGVIAWRAGNQKFDDDDYLLLGRLAAIGSLALHVS